MNKTFSAWTRWSERTGLANLNFPGVYALALSPKNLAGQSFSWQRQIAYIGMTNSKGGLKSRLQQFDNAIKGGEGHGGGHRFRFKYADYTKLSRQLYVSVCPQECDVTSNSPSDLRLMGKVANHEYECFAVFVEAFGYMPEFNDKKRSPKK
jgi:hypothetical protein